MVLSHSIKLAFIDLGGILVGFMVYHLSGAHDQLAVQVPVAVVFTVIGFATWLWMTRRTRIGWSRAAFRQYVLVFLLAFVWAAVVFIPLHYFTQGYVTAWSNVTVMWTFQAPTNLLALLVAHRMFTTRQQPEGTR